MLKLIVTICCCVYCFAVQGQDIDSLLASSLPDTSKTELLNTYAFDLSERDPDSAMSLAMYSLNIARNTGEDRVFANCYNTIGWIFFIKGKHDSAIAYLEKAVALYHGRHMARHEARSLINLAAVYQAEERLEPALEHLLTAIDLLGSSEILEYAVAEKCIGIIYRKRGQNLIAKQYLQKATIDFKSLGHDKYYADAVGSLAIVHFELKNFDSALICYRSAISIYKKLNSLSGLAYAYEGMAAVYFAKGSKQPIPWLDSSTLYFERAYTLFVQLENQQDAAFERFRLGEVMLLKKDYVNAEKYLLESLAEFKSEHKLDQVYVVLLQLGTLYNEIHDYHRAYDFQMRANLYNDTLKLQNKDREIAEMLNKYEADKKDRTIALLNAQNALLTTKKQLAENGLAKQRITIVFVLVLVVFLVTIAFILINRYRIKQRLYELQMRNRISNDLHDDVGSSLSSILLLSNIARGSSSNKPELLDKISENAAEVIERISDIVWATNPSYDDGENLRSKVMKYLVPLCQMQGIKLQMKVSDAIKNIKVSMDSRKNIFLIIKEATNNILKHASATEMTFNMFLREHDMVIEIQDNGIGFDRQSASIGNGLVTLQSRATAMKGRMELETAPGKGTNLRVVIPILRSNYFTIKRPDGVYES